MKFLVPLAPETPEQLNARLADLFARGTVQLVIFRLDGCNYVETFVPPDDTLLATIVAVGNGLFAYLHPEGETIQ